jgi:hypothetical protein
METPACLATSRIEAISVGRLRGTTARPNRNSYNVIIATAEADARVSGEFQKSPIICVFIPQNSLGLGGASMVTGEKNLEKKD